MILVERLGAAYKAIGKRLRNYPAHPSFIRSHQRSQVWLQHKQAGDSNAPSRTSQRSRRGELRLGASFEYVGPAMPRREAQRLLATV